MLRKILQGLGMTVDTADSAEEALEYLRSQKPDVIFMDHTMPGMDGLSALRQIRNDPTTATIPVAMYTSRDEPSYRNQAYAAGAVDVLGKPATPQTLSVILEGVNALLDTGGRPVALAGEGISMELIERLILEKSEQVFYNAVESQVLPLINDVIAKLRLELELNQEEASNRIAAQVVETRLARWQPPSPAPDAQGAVKTALQSQLPPLLEKRLKTFQAEGQAEIERLIREIAAQVSQNQLHTFTNQLVPQLSSRFTESLRKAELSTGEAAVAAAREAAVLTARDTALQAVAEAQAASASASVEESPAATASRVAMELWTEAQRNLQRQIYLAAGGAAAVGIGAALLTYLLG
jgi:CheY-like chemotaxis protein